MHTWMYKRYEHSKTNDKADIHINNSQVRKGDITRNCVSPCIHTHLSPQKEVTIPVSAIIISLFPHEFLPSTPASLYMPGFELYVSGMIWFIFLFPLLNLILKDSFTLMCIIIVRSVSMLDNYPVCEYPGLYLPRLLEVGAVSRFKFLQMLFPRAL